MLVVAPTEGAAKLFADAVRLRTVCQASLRRHWLPCDEVHTAWHVLDHRPADAVAAALLAARSDAFDRITYSDAPLKYGLETWKSDGSVTFRNETAPTTSEPPSFLGCAKRPTRGETGIVSGDLEQIERDVRASQRREIAAHTWSWPKRRSDGNIDSATQHVPPPMSMF